jgi:hypothetical protein
MQAGMKVQDGGRIDVETDKTRRRVNVDIAAGTAADPQDVKLTLTLSEARALSSALMGAAAEA